MTAPSTPAASPRRRALALPGLLALLAGCASDPGSALPDNARVSGLAGAPLLQVLNRIAWGASTSTYRQARTLGIDRYVERQLHPGPDDGLPPAVASQIAGFTISQQAVDVLVQEMEQRRKTAEAIADDAGKKAAQQAYQEEMSRIAKEAAARSLLRDVYSHNQLREQLTWFWMNHFNIFQGKSNLRAMVGDYEETAIRPHVLGKFRDLLGATVFHPAMLRYLDNEQNAVNRLNENYARELMELHTLGVEGGYMQKDVQELARILTGLGVNLGPARPKLRPALESQYVRHGLFEFNPSRHDYGDKVFLGQPLKGQGLAEVDAALDRLCRNPATARFVSRKLAQFFTGAEPSAGLASRMADTFLRSDGDIAQTLATLFSAPEFRASLGGAFRDPVHYVVASVRMAYDERPILNATPMLGWLGRMGETLYGRTSPDGYPLQAAAWQGSGQMATRFDIARSIGSGGAGLFRAEGPQGSSRPGFPQLANALYYEAVEPALGPATRQVLDEAASQGEWNAFLLSSPEWMSR